jgi:hypothetical protein
MAEAGTVETPVLARTAKFFAVRKSTAAGPTARAPLKIAYERKGGQQGGLTPESKVLPQCRARQGV